MLWGVGSVAEWLKTGQVLATPFSIQLHTKVPVPTWVWLMTSEGPSSCHHSLLGSE